MGQKHQREALVLRAGVSSQEISQPLLVVKLKLRGGIGWDLPSLCFGFVRGVVIKIVL
jgi:hypothetical protein